MSPMGERVSSGTLGALNLLRDPRGGSILAPATTWCACYTWWPLARSQQWRQGKLVHVAPV